MPAAYWKIQVDQGETWRMVLRLKNPDGTPLDLTGYSARMQVRESVTSPTPLLSLTSAPGGGITITASDGRVELHVADEITAAWAWRYGLYGLEIESPGGETTALLKGEVEVSAEVTR
ncbi:hypothetical protein ACFFMN_23615 [Planobispora siamensis]|uniref:Uncharacterized protein n=1 Tax=Planobispora siamensis TaxID=936338 RepID=A0A8J3STJ5_9ACTN|nr:hypothetical protein [Planobispora siamensis]GIH95353.1 hypothetical protein Psi01_59830 [Planobispora siamensis]